jgi:hypothetical protein
MALEVLLIIIVPDLAFLFKFQKVHFLLRDVRNFLNQFLKLPILLISTALFLFIQLSTLPN